MQLHKTPTTLQMQVRACSVKTFLKGSSTVRIDSCVFFCRMYFLRCRRQPSGTERASTAWNRERSFGCVTINPLTRDACGSRQTAVHAEFFPGILSRRKFVPTACKCGKTRRNPGTKCAPIAQISSKMWMLSWRGVHLDTVVKNVCTSYLHLVYAKRKHCEVTMGK